MLYVWSRGGYNSARLLENSRQTRDICQRRWTNIETALCECPVFAIEDQWRIQRGGGGSPPFRVPKTKNDHGLKCVTRDLRFQNYCQFLDPPQKTHLIGLSNSQEDGKPPAGETKTTGNGSVRADRNVSS